MVGSPPLGRLPEEFFSPKKNEAGKRNENGRLGMTTFLGMLIRLHTAHCSALVLSLPLVDKSNLENHLIDVGVLLQQGGVVLQQGGVVLQQGGVTLQQVGYSCSRGGAITVGGVLLQ